MSGHMDAGRRTQNRAVKLFALNFKFLTSGTDIKEVTFIVGTLRYKYTVPLLWAPTAKSEKIEYF
jgi:hypothetical protein